MKRLFGIIAAISSVSACGPPTSNEEMWSNAWSEPTPEVMMTLAKQGVRGCGEFYQKENATSPKDFAVACNRMPDGSGKPAWVGYEVFPVIEKIQVPDMTAVWTQFGGPPRADPR